VEAGVTKDEGPIRHSPPTRHPAPTQHPAPSTRHQIVRSLPIVLAGFSAFLDLYATQPLLPLLMREFGASHFAVSLTITVPTLAVAFAAPIVGRLADRIGRKRVIVGSAITLAVTTLLTATATTLTQFILWRLVQGLATPGIFAITIAYVQEEWPSTHVARGMGAYVSGTVTGGFTGRALVAMVASVSSWHVAFVVLGLLNGAIALALVAWLPQERQAPRANVAGHGRSVLRLLTHPQLVATNAVGFCVLFVQVAIFTYVTFYLSESPFLLSTAALGWLFVVYLFGAAVTPFAGRWVDARGHRAGLYLGMTVGGAGAALTLTPWLPVIVVGLAMVGTGVFVSQATASSYIGAVTQEDRGLAVGLYSTWYYLGGSLGGALPAVFWNTGGWLACVLLVMFVQALTAGLALAFWKGRPASALVAESSA
jgi:MFS transporter, YNFM family, putative membrane transport protein